MEVKPGYKQTEVGVIPKDWEVRRVTELVRHGPKNGFSGRTSSEARGTPTLSLSATTSGRLPRADVLLQTPGKRLWTQRGPNGLRFPRSDRHFQLIGRGSLEAPYGVVPHLHLLGVAIATVPVLY